VRVHREQLGVFGGVGRGLRQREVTPVGVQDMEGSSSEADSKVGHQMRKAFERWMIEVAKITVSSEDPYTAELESEHWRVWQAAWQAASS